MSSARLRHVAAAALLLAFTGGVLRFRRAFIASFMRPGPGGAPPPRLAPPASPATGGLEPARRLRVVLLDGVDRETASRLPHLDALCRRGLDLVVDVGFPTVSLPVQSVLWTGLTQQQSGVQFVGRRLSPPLRGIPSRVPGSTAVAEHHPFIVHSLGFARVLPAEPDTLTGAARRAWVEGRFLPEAERAFAGPARLAFVHILRADAAGHESGRASDAFREAARGADRILDALLGADRDAHGDTSRWLVLADHGHRAGGGHGGPEPSIRLVRACLAGDLGRAPPGARPGALIHLVDLSRAIADSLGVQPDPKSAGRPLAAALAAPPQPGATLPRPSGPRWILAAALLCLALAAPLLAAGLRRLWLLPWWWLAGYGAVVLLESVPTLSEPMIYPAHPRAMLVAAAGGLALLAITGAAALRSLDPLRATVALLLPPVALADAALVLCAGTPPLMPVWSAHASLALTFAFAAAAVLAALHLVGAIAPYLFFGGRARRSRSRRPSRVRSSTTRGTAK